MPRKAPRDYTMAEQLARGPLDLPFLMLTMMLLGIGLVMMFSASYAVAYYDPQVSSPYFYIKRQASFAVGGIIIMMIVSHINYEGGRGIPIPKKENLWWLRSPYPSQMGGEQIDEIVRITRNPYLF